VSEQAFDLTRLRSTADGAPDARRLAARLESRCADSRPDGAPTVLLVLTDDAGVGNPSGYRGPIRTPMMGPPLRPGARLQRFARHGTLFSDARHADDRA
jgi:hypothetical protein